MDTFTGSYSCSAVIQLTWWCREAKVQIMCFVPDIMEGTVPKHSSAPVILFLYRLCFTPRKKTVSFFQYSVRVHWTFVPLSCFCVILHQEKKYVFIRVSLYLRTEQLKGCCLACLRWVLSVYTSHSNVRAPGGVFFTTHLITENITAEGWVGSTLRQTSRAPCGYFLRVYAHSILNIDENTTDI